MVGEVFISRSCSNPVTWSTPNLFCTLNLLIPVWWLGIKVDEFTHTWFDEHFVAWSHIYPGFMGKVLTLTNFLLEPGCEDYSFWWVNGRLWAWSWFHPHWLYEPLELDESFDEPDVMIYSVSSGFLCLASTILINLNCSLLLASNLSINYGTSLWHFFFLYHWQAACQPLNGFSIFPVI